MDCNNRRHILFLCLNGIVGLTAGLLSAQGVYGPSSHSIINCGNNSLKFII